jgi:2-phosphoglycolate phosphatase
MSDGRFRAVLFDLDGTLVDSYGAIALSVNHVRRLHGLDPLPEAEVRRFVGRGVYYLLENTVPRGSIEENVAAYRAHHPSVIRDHTVLLPGAGEVLRLLDERGYLLGICSNKPVAFTRELADQLGLMDHLDAVLGPEDVARPKPAPDMLRAALDRLGVAPEDTLYVGDMTIDVETARALPGVRVWVVPTGLDDEPTLRAAGPDRLLRDLNELGERLS